MSEARPAYGHEGNKTLRFESQLRDIRKKLPLRVLSGLALSDTDAETGGFQCVPELFRTFESWIPAQPADRNPFQPDTTGFEIRFVSMRVGDMLIFNTLLAHGIRPNNSADRPRLAQYISMYPADENNEDVRQERIRSWRDREPPKGYAFPGDPREWEKMRYERAQLTEIGERLLGLRSWKS